MYRLNTFLHQYKVFVLVNNAKYAPCLAALAICPSSVIRCLTVFPSLFLPLSWDAYWIWKNHIICNEGFAAKVYRLYWQWQAWLYSTPFVTRRRPTLRHWSQHTSRSAHSGQLIVDYWMYRGTTWRDTAVGISRVHDRPCGMRSRKVSDWNSA